MKDADTQGFSAYVDKQVDGSNTGIPDLAHGVPIRRLLNES